MKKGEVWWVEIPHVDGHEQSGSRPAVVLRETSGMVVSVPLTMNMQRVIFEYTCILYPDRSNGLHKESVALLFQIASLDRKRFRSRLGILTKEDIIAFNMILKDMLDI